MALRKWDLDGPDVEKFDVADICKYLGNISRQTLSRMIRGGKFPRPRRIGGRPTWTGRDIGAYELLADRWYPKPKEGKREPQPRRPRKKGPARGEGEAAE